MATALMSAAMPSIEKMAATDFEQARHSANWRGWFSWLTRKRNHLLPLGPVLRQIGYKGQHSAGFQTVLLNRIVGSDGHHLDFDQAFFPRQNRTRQRWLNIDTAHYKGIPLPPVELTKIGDMYFVTDGNHRISVARARGQEFIDAFVTEIDTLAPVPAEVWS